ncbi:hypothetical protein NBO_18g0014 [Nosema bombycis CQ1]|uniref:Uncharacterized protein n=1 Tax=Nosema bombycis (strain CQ1 / CVCC 102059) TaxID=578461 RepID=R0KWS7_NOSB1|nr:hypothetical protein NBO_18g0014 [Nosema bombycis CQ1]|eukprot:EOB14687.1 hypothetical protein NBO_18g0014 [Nosema bombycis CQ1]
MPVLILLEQVKHLLDTIKDQLSSIYDIEVHKFDFQTTKQQLSNLNKSKLYILLNCDLKPYRYELYCLVKKQEDSYAILSSTKLSTAKHDNPCLIAGPKGIDIQKILDVFDSTLRCSTAHKKKIISGNYVTRVKERINRINDDYDSSFGVVLKDCETRIMRMINLNPIDLDEVENCYKIMVEKSIKEHDLT